MNEGAELLLLCSSCAEQEERRRGGVPVRGESVSGVKCDEEEEEEEKREEREAAGDRVMAEERGTSCVR